MDISVVIVAAGRGQRMNALLPKQYLYIGSKMIIEHTLDFWESCPGVGEIVLVLPETDVFAKGSLLEQRYSRLKAVVPGGADRTESVRAGLNQISPQVEVVAVHDGVRPLLTEAVLKRLIEALEGECACAIPVVQVKDTIKKIDESGRVVCTLDRDRLVAVQTPQLFRRRLLEKLLDKPRSRPITDEATLCEEAGEQVQTVWGDPRNIKITTEEDLSVARLFLEELR